MHWLKGSRIAAAAVIALAVVGPNMHAQGAPASAVTTVTMYAGTDLTPYGGKINTQHLHVVTAMQVLATQFQKQTGIQIKFANPAIGSTSGTSGFPDYNRYLQATTAANTAPDIVAAIQGVSWSQLGWFENLDSLLAQPNPFVTGNKHLSDLYYPAMLKLPEGNGGTLNGNNHHYELAVQGNYPYIVIGTFYNKDLWKKAGITAPPTTWEQWMQQLAKLKTAGIAGMAPNTGENRSGSLWPLWSTLTPPFTAALAAKADTNHDGTLSTLEVSQAIANGTISMSDPHMQAAWLQYKRQASYYLPGWNATDIEAAWTAGKMAERYGGFWEIPTEKSNTGLKYQFGFFAPVPVTTATSPLVTAPVQWEPTGVARLAHTTYANGFGIVTNSVKRDNNQAAVDKWLQFITTPQANEFLINENVVGVPVVVGAHPAPLYNSLNDLPVPAYKYITGVYPYQTYTEEFTAVAKESVIWLLGQEDDATFFSHVQATIMQYAKQYITDNKKAS
jgi:raffinose/stachyose/melibiose transport system substrate-binding protein